MKHFKIKNLIIFLVLILSVAFFTLGCLQNNPGGDNGTYNNAIPLYEVDSFYNIVILTELKDAEFNQNDYQIIDKAFNDKDNLSLRYYYNEQSCGQLDIISVYVFYKSSMTIKSFKNLGTSAQIEFVKNALNGQTIYNDITKTSIFNGNLDSNDDGNIDSITLYLPIQISNDDSTTAAWPHTVLGEGNFLHTFKGLSYNRFVVNSYEYTGRTILKAPIGVMCHEMFHNIGNDVGVNDLYPYPDSSDPFFESKRPVGGYCVMGYTDYQNPQPLNAYYKSKLGWLELKTTEGGTETFFKTDSTAVKFGERGSEFFIAQYWPKSNYNDYPTNEGIVFYRINSSVTTGNMQKPDNEIYTIRNGTYADTNPSFNAVFTNNSDFNKLTYSNGDTAQINVRIELSSDSVMLTIEQYSLSFILDGEKVPYEITITLNTVTEQTTNGSYIFSSSSIDRHDIIYFRCDGYYFYSDEECLNPINSFAPTQIGEFNIKIYVLAHEKSITLHLKDYQGNALNISMNNLTYTVNQNTKQAFVENFLIKIDNVKNGDIISFSFQGYVINDLEVTPDIKGTQSLSIENSVELNFFKLCDLSGTVKKSNGKALADIRIFVDGKYAATSDDNGKFVLTNLAQGSVLTFESKSYTIPNHTVIEDNENLIINASKIPNNSLYVIITALAVILIIIVVTLIVTFTKKKSHFTNENYFE